MGDRRDEYEAIAEHLRSELANAEKKYRAREIDATEYLILLQRFNNFILRGKLPADLDK